MSSDYYDNDEHVTSTFLLILYQSPIDNDELENARKRSQLEIARNMLLPIFFDFQSKVIVTR